MATQQVGGTSEAAVVDATGRDWGTWYSWLHEHGAEGLDHAAIVRLLDEDAELASGWWRQQVTNSFEQHIGRRRPGSAADGTFQVGVRRTFRSSPTRTWDLIASPQGAAAWLGEAPDEWWHGLHPGGPERGDLLELPGGQQFEVRGYKAGERIRLRASGHGQPTTTIQLNVIPEQGRTVVNLHQEGLPEEAMREQMREHWTRALQRIADLLDGE